MRYALRLGAFLRAPAARKRLALEAAWELLRARALTLRSAGVFTAALGMLAQEGQAEILAGTEAVAEEIGHVVAVVARCMPFRARCLQQAIAVRRMLERRGIPATVHLGVARDAADRARAAEGRAAHAWVTVGSRVVSGEAGLESYAVVARFA